MKFIPISLLLIAVCTSAQEVMVALDKDSALQACEEKAQNSPENTRNEMLSSCRCVVENTDFDQAAQYSEAGDDDALKALYEKAGKACQTTE